MEIYNTGHTNKSPKSPFLPPLACVTLLHATYHLITLLKLFIDFLRFKDMGELEHTKEILLLALQKSMKIRNGRGNDIYYQLSQQS